MGKTKNDALADRRKQGEMGFNKLDLPSLDVISKVTEWNLLNAPEMLFHSHLQWLQSLDQTLVHLSFLCHKSCMCWERLKELMSQTNCLWERGPEVWPACSSYEGLSLWKAEPARSPHPLTLCCAVYPAKPQSYAIPFSHIRIIMQSYRTLSLSKRGCEWGPVSLPNNTSQQANAIMQCATDNSHIPTEHCSTAQQIAHDPTFCYFHHKAIYAKCGYSTYLLSRTNDWRENSTQSSKKRSDQHNA